MHKEIFEGENFYLVREQKGEKSDLPSIIKTSGYTIDRKGINENWFLTQLRTLPCSNRHSKPDPVIFENSKKSLIPYDGREVFSLYLKPSCLGIAYAQAELSSFVNSSNKTFSFVGHSKGGLILAGLNIQKPSKFILIAPTFGTIMGDETQLNKQIDTYISKHSCNIFQKLELNVCKGFVHLIGSRRPVDLDMAPNSVFLQNLSLDGLRKHRVLLITATCPNQKCSMQDAFFKHLGSFLGLDLDGDGMVSIESQMFVKDYAEKIISVHATHPTVLNNQQTLQSIKRFLNA